MCVLLLTVAGSIFLAVAFGAGRRAAPPDNGGKGTLGILDTSGFDPDETPANESASDSESEKDQGGMNNGEASSDKKPTSADPEEDTASVSIDDIDFIPPADGGVIVSCSLDVPVYSLTMNDYRAHTGVDIAAPIGSEVVSCADGVISGVFEDPMMGMTVSIAHGEGIESVYKNLSPELPDGITVGVTVMSGDVIGAVGDTAIIECEEEPHIHFELAVNGKNVDVHKYLDLVDINKVFEDR